MKKVVSGKGQEQIVSEKAISEDQVAEVFNKLFINIIPNLQIPTNHNYVIDFVVTIDQVTNALNKFRNHWSIVMIKNRRKIDECFSFATVTCDDLLSLLKDSKEKFRLFPRFTFVETLTIRGLFKH